MKYYLIAAAILLTSCAGPQDVLKKEQAACALYGFNPGTESFSNCMMQVDQQWTNRVAAQQRSNNNSTHCFGSGRGLTCY